MTQRLLAFAILGLWLVPGCRPPPRPARRSPEAADYRGASAGGRTTSAARSSTSVSTSGTVAMTSEATALSMTVERERTADGDYSLRGGFAFDGWEVRLTALPARYPDHVGVSVRSGPVRTITYRDCAVRVMADGIMLEDLAHESYDISGGSTTGYRETLRTIAPRGELVLMASAERLALRICDDEIRLGPEHRAVIAELLLRFEEELRWLADDSRTETPVQDLTATPPP